MVAQWPPKGGRIISDRIAVYGCGYVGLTFAALLVSWGYAVSAVDLDPGKISSLRQGRAHLREPGLEELLAEGLSTGRLAFTLDGATAAAEADIAIIAVGTPSGPGGSVDLQYVETAFQTITDSSPGPELVVVKSTVPPGTAGRLQPLAPAREIVIHPEFLRQGSAVADLRNPARRVFGARNVAAAERVIGLYPDGDIPIVITDPVTAELSKYASNAFLAVKVSFVNASASLCEALGADVADITRIMGLDPRIGNQFLQPGIGFGGSCLPKDTEALVVLAREYREEFLPGAAALAVNRGQPTRFVRRMLTELPPAPVVAVWGLTFKAGTDDVRCSPAFQVVRELIERGATIRAYDPLAAAAPEGALRCESPLEAAQGADAVAVLTEWPEFRQVDWVSVARAMRGRGVFDGRNVTDGDAVRAVGLRWVSLGRPELRKGETTCMPS